MLEYLLSDGFPTGIGSLELFPFKDGKHHAIDDHDTFIGRNDIELDLFDLQNDHNIDFDRLSIATATVLRGWCSSSVGHGSIRYRHAEDFRNYCLSFVFMNAPREEDVVSLDIEAASFVPRAWSWIVEQNIDMLGVISDLWMIPLTNGRYRKLKPRDSSSESFFAPPGPVGDYMKTFDAKYSSKIKPLLETTGLTIPAQERLVSIINTSADLRIRNGVNKVDFAQWLYQIREVVDSAPEKEKDKLVDVLVQKFETPTDQAGYQSIRNDIGALQIFKKIGWEMDGDKA